MGEGMTVQEAGRLGGSKTAERHGREFYQRIGKKGGAANVAQHGREHFQAIGRKGGGRMSELVVKGRAVLEAGGDERE